MSETTAIASSGQAPAQARLAERSGASLRSKVAIIFLLAAGFALTILVFQPGYMTVDARYVYGDGQSGTLNDWQSPVMAVLWRLIDPAAPGAWSMFLLIATLYWLAFGVLAFDVARRVPWLGIATPIIALAPPAFFFVGMIWRDVLFAAVWLLAAVLTLAAAERARPARAAIQALALLLIAFGVLLRPNALIAAPVLAAYALWPRRFEPLRTAIVFIPAALACYALIPSIYYGVLHAKRVNPLHQIFVYDLGGITYFSGENQFPVSWSADESMMLTSTCYDPVRWDGYWHVPPCPFVMRRLEQPDDVIFGSERLVAAWRRALIVHPIAYLQHRASFMWNFLGRPNLVLPYLDWEGPHATYGSNRYFRPLLALHSVLERTLLFRVGLWLSAAAATVLAAWRLRRTPLGAFAIGVCGSAIVYVMTFAVVGIASDFRYAYWCVLATLAGGTATVAARRVGRLQDKM
jgi:hypothetical protein